MIAASFLMQHQPILNHTLEKQKEAMDEFIGDSMDKSIESYSMCRDCTRRSRACQVQCSIKEIEETALLWENMSLIQNPQHPLNPKMKVVMVHYPLDAPIDQLFPQSHSNSAQYKLHKKGLLSEFHDQIVKSVKEDHCIMPTREEGEKMLKQNHCFSGINDCIKQGSISHKLRLVTNSNSNHANGSLNSHVTKGINLLGSLKNTFTKFHLKMYAIMLDLARA